MADQNAAALTALTAANAAVGDLFYLFDITESGAARSKGMTLLEASQLWPSYEAVANSTGNSTITPAARVRKHHVRVTVTGTASTRILVLATTSRILGDRVRMSFVLPDVASIILQVRNATTGGTLLYTYTTVGTEATDGYIFAIEFVWTGSAWVSDGVQGPPGDPGLDGDDGADGKTILNGSGAPGAGTGVDGDFYIDTAADTIYGPKTGGAWGSPTSIVGPQGSTGTPGAGVTWQGAWEAGTYYAFDAVGHLGSSWICNASATTEEPGPLATDWDVWVEKGETGTGVTQSQDIEIGTDEVDFADTELYKTLSISANTTFTGVNYTEGLSQVYVVKCDGTLRTLTFPEDWVFVGPKPASIAANKTGVLSLLCTTNYEAGVVASWAVQE